MKCIRELSCSSCGFRSDHKLGTATDEDMSLYHVYKRKCPGCGVMSMHDADIVSLRNEPESTELNEMPVSSILARLREVSSSNDTDQDKIDEMYDLGYTLHCERMVG